MKTWLQQTHSLYTVKEKEVDILLTDRLTVRCTPQRRLHSSIWISYNVDTVKAITVVDSLICIFVHTTVNRIWNNKYFVHKWSFLYELPKTMCFICNESVRIYKRYNTGRHYLQHKVTYLMNLNLLRPLARNHTKFM